MNMQVDKLFLEMHTWVTFEKVFYAAELGLGFYMFKKPSKSEVIGRCGGNEKNEWSRRTDKNRTLKNNKKNNTEIEQANQRLFEFGFTNLCHSFFLCMLYIVKTLV